MIFAFRDTNRLWLGGRAPSEGVSAETIATPLYPPLERSNKEQESECTSLQQPRYTGTIVFTELRWPKLPRKSILAPSTIWQATSAIRSRLERRRASNLGCTTSDGTQRSKWVILQTPRQLRRDAIALEDPPNHQVKKAWAWDKWRRLQSKQSEWKLKIPQKGQPNSSAPPEMMPTLQTATGNSEKVESPEGQKISHFTRFKCRPKAGPSWENNVNEVVSEDRGPIKVLSSRYHNDAYCTGWRLQSYYVCLLRIESKRYEWSRTLHFVTFHQSKILIIQHGGSLFMKLLTAICGGMDRNGWDLSNQCGPIGHYTRY